MYTAPDILEIGKAQWLIKLFGKEPGPIDDLYPITTTLCEFDE